MKKVAHLVQATHGSRRTAAADVPAGRATKKLPHLVQATHGSRRTASRRYK
ncbi:MAG TPA: hypothetical protein VHZ49_17305 [Methylomirabilota bacterium]|nr:hypothetical protein [Methylomirabilota bacterium]